MDYFHCSLIYHAYMLYLVSTQHIKKHTLINITHMQQVINMHQNIMYQRFQHMWLLC